METQLRGLDFPPMWASHWSLGISHKKRTPKPPSGPEGSCKTTMRLGTRSYRTVIVLPSTESWRTVMTDGERNRLSLYRQWQSPEEHLGRERLWQPSLKNRACFTSQLLHIFNLNKVELLPNNNTDWRIRGKQCHHYILPRMTWKGYVMRLIVVLKNPYVDILTLHTSECDLMWEWVFTDMLKLELSH